MHLTDTEKDLADSEVLDPETPDEMFEFMQARRGLFRHGGLLRPGEGALATSEARSTR